MTSRQLRLVYVALLALVLTSAACSGSPTAPTPVVPPPVVVVPPVVEPTPTGIRIMDFTTVRPAEGTIMERTPENKEPKVLLWAQLRYDFQDVPLDENQTAKLWVCLTDTEGKFISSSCVGNTLSKKIDAYAEFPTMYDLSYTRSIETTTKIVAYIVRGQVNFWALPRIGGGAYIDEASISSSILARAEISRTYHWRAPSQ
jgi:hypothetical protein